MKEQTPIRGFRRIGARGRRLAPDLWEIYRCDYCIPGRFAKEFPRNFAEKLLERILWLSWRFKRCQRDERTAAIAGRDFRGKPGRALVEPVGTEIIIVRFLLARR
jgi:hypothetical protein